MCFTLCNIKTFKDNLEGLVGRIFFIGHKYSLDYNGLAAVVFYTRFGPLEKISTSPAVNVIFSVRYRVETTKRFLEPLIFNCACNCRSKTVDPVVQFCATV